jgi:hypothetical protein
MASPLQQVTEKHGGKEKLVDKLLGIIERGEEAKDELRTRLLSASNSKLLRLFAVSTEMKEKFGGKDKLVDALLGLLNRAKDGDYREKLLSLSPTRLLDLYRSKQKKTKAG